jgi:hypothetical protein
MHHRKTPTRFLHCQQQSHPNELPIEAQGLEWIHLNLQQERNPSSQPDLRLSAHTQEDTIAP